MMLQCAKCGGHMLCPDSMTPDRCFFCTPVSAIPAPVVHRFVTNLAKGLADGSVTVPDAIAYLNQVSGATAQPAPAKDPCPTPA